jgi:phosphoserine aminotransferase
MTDNLHFTNKRFGSGPSATTVTGENAVRAALTNPLTNDTNPQPNDTNPQPTTTNQNPASNAPTNQNSPQPPLTNLIGTSHRHADIKSVVEGIRTGISAFYNLPPDYEVLISNGGASSFWDSMAYSLQVCTISCANVGVFSEKAIASFRSNPRLKVIENKCDPGEFVYPTVSPEVDLYHYVQNETSTGASGAVKRIGPDLEDGTNSATTDATKCATEAATSATTTTATQNLTPLTAVDATSAAGGLPVDITQTDIYYFSPQKCFASEGGLWVAILSPRAIELIENSETPQGCPPSLNLKSVLKNSRGNQTINTPAILSLVMLNATIDSYNAQASKDGYNSGIEWANARTAANSKVIYDWCESHKNAGQEAGPNKNADPVAGPALNYFVKNPAHRSAVTCVIELDAQIDVSEVIKQARAEFGIKDIASYRALGLNAFRIATFPQIESSDLVNLTKCLDTILQK